jgi:hypothetical protein
MRLACLIATVLAALAAARVGEAAWSAAVSGQGATKSKTMPAANGVPSGSVSGHDVTVTWSASQFADGSGLPGYVVKRYDAVTNAQQTVLSACSGVVTGTSCVEHSVPTGTWKYTVTPAAGSWRGTESAQSETVIVLL